MVEVRLDAGGGAGGDRDRLPHEAAAVAHRLQQSGQAGAAVRGAGPGVPTREQPATLEGELAQILFPSAGALDSLAIRASCSATAAGSRESRSA